MRCATYLTRLLCFDCIALKYLIKSENHAKKLQKLRIMTETTEPNKIRSCPYEVKQSAYVEPTFLRPSGRL